MSTLDITIPCSWCTYAVRGRRTEMKSLCVDYLSGVPRLRCARPIRKGVGVFQKRWDDMVTHTKDYMIW